MELFDLFDPSLTPDQDSPEYLEWCHQIDSDKVKQLQNCGTNGSPDANDLRWALSMNGSGLAWNIDQLNDEEVFQEAANQVQSGKLIVIGDLLDQKPERWLLSPEQIEQGRLETNQRDAGWQHRAFGSTPFAQDNNLPIDAPSSTPVPPPVINQQHWLDIRVLDDETGQPIRGVSLDVTVPEGSKGKSGTYQTDNQGKIEIMSLKSGSCKVECPSNAMTYKNTLAYQGSGKTATPKISGSKTVGDDYTIADVEEYQVKAGDTLASIAAEKGVSESDIAQFNWETTDQKEINQHLVNDIGGTADEEVNGAVTFESSDNLGKLLIPQSLSMPPMQTMSSKVIRVKQIVRPIWKRIDTVASSHFGVFFDGTGNNMAKDIPKECETNIVKLYELYNIDDTDEFKNNGRRYFIGVGSTWGTAAVGGFTGAGGFNRVHEAYEVVTDHFNKKENKNCKRKILNVFGFSRGAAQARHFVNYIKYRGILDRDSGKQMSGIEVQFLGIFDTVGSFGLPGNAIDPGYDFHVDGHYVKNTAHFTAEHESRTAFDLLSTKSSSQFTLSSNMIEKSFPGVHSDVGGGYEYQAYKAAQVEWHGNSSVTLPEIPEKLNHLSRIPLHHMYDAAINAGVRMDPITSHPRYDKSIKISAELQVFYDQNKKGLARDKAILSKYIHDSRIDLIDKVGETFFKDKGQREIFYLRPNPGIWENEIEDEQDTLYEDNYGYLDIE